uniref:CHCH domain-containing protein n=1 Tax=Eutreptiella gymnastica TaxID=73025 RepID=A0A7S4CLN4_9EUGL
MGRGSRRSSPAPARAPAPAPARAPAPAPTASPTAPMAQHAAPAPAPAGGGFMSNVMSTAAGVAVGHMASTAIMSAMSGGEQKAAVAEAQTNVPTNCNFQLETFNKCLEKSSDPSQCQWIYEELTACKNSNKF